MKTVVIGGSGLIGSRLARRLADRGHTVLAASPATGVNAVTGEGLGGALQDAEVVIDVSNAPVFTDEGVMSFFQSAGRNLAAEERKAGVRHHVTLSVVGTDRLQESGYFRGKLAQETIVTQAGVPWTILRATQLFEFIRSIAEAGASSGEIRVPSARVRPIAADDVADILATVAEWPAANAVLEAAGPQDYEIADVVRRVLDPDDARPVVAHAKTAYFGAPLADETLLPGPRALPGRTTLDAWLSRQA